MNSMRIFGNPYFVSPLAFFLLLILISLGCKTPANSKVESECEIRIKDEHASFKINVCYLDSFKKYVSPFTDETYYAYGFYFQNRENDSIGTVGRITISGGSQMNSWKSHADTNLLSAFEYRYEFRERVDLDRDDIQLYNNQNTRFAYKSDSKDHFIIAVADTSIYEVRCYNMSENTLQKYLDGFEIK